MRTHDDVPGLALRRRGRVAELVIDRPEKRNALTFEMWSALPDLVGRVEDDDDLAVLVVRGEGGTFSAGADIGEFGSRRSDAEGADLYNRRVEEAELALLGASKPSIAMIEGYCLGGGCELALACDLRVAARSAVLGITPANIGLVYAFTSTRRLVQAVGAGYAKYLLFSAAHVEADEAHRARLVDQLLDPQELEDHVFSLADRIATRSQFSVRGAKVLVDKAAAGTTEADEEATALVRGATSGADYREGVAAFLDKRTPRFGASADTRLDPSERP